VRRHLTVDARVDRSHEPDRRPELQGAGGALGQVEHRAAYVGRLLGRAQGEDRTADVLDRRVEVVDGTGDAIGEVGPIGEHAGRVLQAESDGEQPLDDEVVEVPTD